MIKLCISTNHELTNKNYELAVYYGDHNMSDIMVTAQRGDKMTLEQFYLKYRLSNIGPDNDNSDLFILENLLFSLLMEQVSYLSELLSKFSGEPVENVTIQNNKDRIMNLVDIKNSLIKKLDEEEKKKKLFGDAIEDPSFKNKTKWLFFGYLLNLYEEHHHVIKESHIDTFNEHFVSNVKEFYSDMVGVYSSEGLLKSYDIEDADDMHLVLVGIKKRILEKSKIDKANLK